LFWRSHPVDDATLNGYVDGELDDADRARVDAHAATCPACRDALTELVVLRESLSALPRARAPRSFALRESDVREEARPQPGTLQRWQPALSGVAVMAFAAFFLLVGIDMLSVSSTTPDSLLTADDAESPEDAGQGAEAPAAGDGDQDERGPAPAAEDSDADVDGEDGLIESSEGFVSSPEATRAAGFSASPPAPSATAQPAPSDKEAGDDDTNVALRVAEALAALIALAASGALAVAWWRRRAS
jgi:hypothetical protein